MATIESDSFLASKAAQLIRENFKNKEITNLLIVKYGRKWKNKLGHIKPIKNNPNFGTVIELNALFKDSNVPNWIVDLTLMHELVHYFQGFGSNIPREKIHPHKGGCVDKELEKFGYTELLRKQKKWLKENWLELYSKHTGYNSNVKRNRRKKGLIGKLLSLI